MTLDELEIRYNLNNVSKEESKAYHNFNEDEYQTYELLIRLRNLSRLSNRSFQKVLNAASASIDDLYELYGDEDETN